MNSDFIFASRVITFSNKLPYFGWVKTFMFGREALRAEGLGPSPREWPQNAWPGTRYAGFPATLVKIIILGYNGLTDFSREMC